MVQRDEGFAQRVLERMQVSGIVEATRSTARRQRPSYRLTPETIASMPGALTYRVGSIDSDDQKLLRHLRRHGRISNQDVQDHLNCDVLTARNRLTRLRQKRWIDFAPDSPRRGPGVDYVSLAAVDEMDEG